MYNHYYRKITITLDIYYTKSEQNSKLNPYKDKPGNVFFARFMKKMPDELSGLYLHLDLGDTKYPRQGLER